MGVQVFRDHIEKAEDVRETGPGGGSGGKTKQASAMNSPARQQGELEVHKFALRQTTAYSGLRTILTVTACLTAIVCVILGVVLLNFSHQ